MIHIAEYVSPGHPDRLADAIVENLVQAAQERDNDAFCGVECAIFQNEVFIDGRISSGHGLLAVTADDVQNAVQQTFIDAGYVGQWKRHTTNLHNSLILTALDDYERQNRGYADDQNIVTGYACLSPLTNFMPPAHYLAITIGNRMVSWRQEHNDIFGPDFKLLLQVDYVDEPNNIYNVTQISVSIQHSADISFYTMRQMIFDFLDTQLKILQSSGFNGIGNFEIGQLFVNGYGKFTQGGPDADNGLSGKKLVIDFYGPDVAIGGGAVSGKDNHKIDVCGAFGARRLALKQVTKSGAHAALVHLAWQPGETSPAFGTVRTYDTLGNAFIEQVSKEQLEDLTIENLQSCIPTTPRPQMLRQGYFNF